MYYFLTRGGEKQKDRVDSVIARATSTWNRELMETVKRAAPTTPKPTTMREPNERERRLPAPPPGWGSDEDASRSSMVAAKMLRQGGR